MKKLIACFLCILMLTLFAGCNLSNESDIPDEGNTDVSEYTMPRLESEQNTTETPQTVLDVIAIIENAYSDESYLCEYIGDDMLKVAADGTYYVNVNDEVEETDEAFYCLRLYTDATDDPNADYEGTIARFYVNQSTGVLYIMDTDSGTLTEVSFE